MKHAHGGCRSQFEALVIEHHVRLRAFVRSLGAHPDWVDDIAQEAFLIAYREWDSYDQTRDFGRWVRGIAANILRNEIRKDARRQRILRTELSALLLNDAENRIEEDEPVAIDAVRTCIDKLTPKSKKIVQKRYRDGLTAPSIAKVLDLSAANVRQMLVRIRRQIRECVEAQTKGEV